VQGLGTTIPNTWSRKRKHNESYYIFMGSKSILSMRQYQRLVKCVCVNLWQNKLVTLKMEEREKK
jgi:hypothetical protein